MNNGCLQTSHDLLLFQGLGLRVSHRVMSVYYLTSTRFLPLHTTTAEIYGRGFLPGRPHGVPVTAPATPPLAYAGGQPTHPFA